MQYFLLTILSCLLAYGGVNVWLDTLPRTEIVQQAELSLAPSVQMIHALRWDKCLKKHPYLKEKLPVVLNILAKEQELERDYFIFYHAASSLSFLYDTIDLYVEEVGRQKLNDFTFMRVPWKKEFVEHGMKAEAINATLLYEKRYSELQKKIDEAFFDVVVSFADHDWVERITSERQKDLLYSTFHLFTHEHTFDSHSMHTKFGELASEGILCNDEDKLGIIDTLKKIDAASTKEGESDPALVKFVTLRNEHLDSSFALHQHFSDYILSVNNSLFGNLYSGYDCTLDYWKSGKNHIRPNIITELVQFCRQVGIDSRFVDEGLKLYEEIEKEDSWIYMLCVPKRVLKDGIEVNPLTEIGYLSFGGYTPAHIYEDVMESYPYLKDLDSYMDRFSKESAKTAMAHRMQGRLVLNTSYLLNPFSGCKILKYSMLQDERYQLFKQRLRLLLRRYHHASKSGLRCVFTQECTDVE